MNQVQMQMAMIVFQELSRKDFAAMSDSQKSLYEEAVRFIKDQIRPPTIVPAAKLV